MINITPNRTKFIKTFSTILLIGVGACLLYNWYTMFFPLAERLEHDEAEHLHVAYLMSIGERPFVDFIENHPMLFHHYLNWAQNTFHIQTTRSLATFARSTIFAHFLICVAIFYLWTSRMIERRPKGIIWVLMLLSAWVIIDLFHPFLVGMWQIRPDFICYAYTLIGSYLFFIWLKKSKDHLSFYSIIILICAGGFIGFGNAILPKGSVFLTAILAAVIFAELIKKPKSFSGWFNTHNISGTSIFIISCTLSFITFMILDCCLSQITIGKWIAGVFLINSKRHIVFSPYGDNPIKALTCIFALPFPMLLALTIWILYELTALKHWTKNDEGNHYLLLFSVLTIVVNLLTAPFTNGITWSYNFIPSVFAAAIIYLQLILRVSQILNKNSGGRFLRPQTFIISSVFALVAIQMILQPLYVISKHNERISTHREIQRDYPSYFLLDMIMPSSYTYLSHYPYQLPVRCRNWNYYFFLANNMNFWRDCYQLGMGPDPNIVFEKGFGDNPPDAIVFENSADLNRYVLMLYFCHKLDVSWLTEAIKIQYTPMRNMGVSMYARNDHIQELEKMGWQLLSIEARSLDTL